MRFGIICGPIWGSFAVGDHLRRCTVLIMTRLGIWEWGDKGWCKGLGSSYPGTAGLESVQTWWRTPEGNWRKVGSMNKKIAVNVVIIKDRWSRTFFVFCLSSSVCSNKG